jgi:putative SOS response-associated peptidase YedK
MPCIIGSADFDRWLDCRPGTAAGLEGLLKPAQDDLLEIVEVSRKLNNPRNEGPEVQELVRTTLF